ncbi:MATE family efflux transporter [uncultured Clostridium sp.]|uniref:MATE family efflux transporter n=1 Tax=uncultured Clostridium sp. TaxID=59620 RepID=UPI0026398349|nr:MATE family efflux transporter [uncultured Clostridium sp.]
MKKVDLTKGNVFKVILRLAIPIMSSSILQFAYSIIDMFWVGKLGSDAVAAIGTTSFLISLGYSILSMIVIGVSVRVSQSIGSGDIHKVKEYLNIGMITTLVIGSTYALIVFLCRDLFVGFFVVNDISLFNQTKSYLSISCIIFIFSVFNILYSRVSNSFGNNKLALKISILGIVLNIILDPIFIYILKIGVDGAAIATLISQIIMFLLFTLIKSSPFRYDFKEKISLEKTLDVIKLGIPMAMQRSLFTLVNIVLAKFIADFGVYAMAAQKIGIQVESITLMVIGGINGAISAFTGQNFGKGSVERINKGYNSALIIGGVYAIITTIVFLVIPEKIAGIFVSQKETINITANYLRIIGSVQIFSAIEVISNGVFTGIGKPKIPALISIIFTILRIPMALVLINLFGVTGIWISIAISSTLKGITAILIYKIKTEKEILSKLTIVK